MAKQKGEFWWGFHPENGKKRFRSESEALEWETGIPTLEVEEIDEELEESED